ncbi:uncharacterized protein LOC126830314 [Patella vulgata]|uniref:uncharacterized protein LOC126830314 n=1 Tax=Patella vulgata TaxID=6465 RepID=UPI00217F7C0D|nr:uncharacterized protein LOC126830314 [Patella vulgata]
MAERKEEKINCSICLNHFTKPKIIDCFHTFCESCLYDYVIRRAQYNRFPCPLCRKSIRVPNGGVKEFSTNFYIEEKPVEDVSKTAVCSHHKLEIEYYCRDCYLAVCFKCFVVDHKGHTGEYIEDVAVDAKTELEEIKDNLSKRISKAEKLSNFLFSERQRVTFSTDLECDKVDRHVKSVCAAAELHGLKLKENIRNSSSAWHKHVGQMLKDMNNSVKVLKQIAEKVADILDKGRVVEMLDVTPLVKLQSMVESYHCDRKTNWSEKIPQFKKGRFSEERLTQIVGKITKESTFVQPQEIIEDDHDDVSLSTQLGSLAVKETCSKVDIGQVGTVDVCVQRDLNSLKLSQEVPADHDTAYSFKELYRTLSVSQGRRLRSRRKQSDFRFKNKDNLQPVEQNGALSIQSSDREAATDSTVSVPSDEAQVRVISATDPKNKTQLTSKNVPLEVSCHPSARSASIQGQTTSNGPTSDLSSNVEFSAGGDKESGDKATDDKKNMAKSWESEEKTKNSNLKDSIYGEPLPKLLGIGTEDVLPTKLGEIILNENERSLKFEFDLQDVEKKCARKVQKVNDLGLMVEVGRDSNSSLFIDVGLKSLGLYKMSFMLSLATDSDRPAVNQFVEAAIYGYWGPSYRWNKVVRKETLLDFCQDKFTVEITLSNIKRIK